MDINQKVNEFIKKHDRWSEGLIVIRKILLDTELEEDIKWGMPTYRYKGKNVVSFCGFKNHFGIWFHNGSFLRDELNILENAQEGKTKGMRHIKYSDDNKINEQVAKAYILEAIQNQKDGKEIKLNRKAKTLEVPELLKSNLSEIGLSQLKSFSNSKRNDYIEYITSAKREETKMKRLIKIIPMIESGVGLNDMYKSK
jgi:uncharacterized protein YdeI (YjbR/CyaY-like superfamily)